MTDLDKIRSIPRAIIRKHHRVHRLVLAVDAGQFALGALLYIITRNSRDKDDIQSTLFLGRSKIHSYTIPVAELYSINLGMKLISEALESCQHLNSLND